MAGALLVAGAAGAYAFVAGCGSGAREGAPGTSAQSAAMTDTADGGEGMHHHHVPPPAAFDACKSKTVGDDCTVSWHDREIQGKCETPPQGSPQSGPACRPHHWRMHGPPPEIVFAACDGKAAGDACTVTHQNGTVQGSCMAPRFDGGTSRLLCAAAHGHRHDHDGGKGGT